MSAAHDIARPPAAKPASATITHRPTQWAGEVYRLIAIPTVAGPAKSTPQAVVQLAALSAARVRLGLPDLGHGHQRTIAAGMAAAAFVSGLPWVPDHTPAWIAHTDPEAALRALAEGLRGQCIAAGLPVLRGRWRIMPAGVAGRFLDAREGPSQPALFPGPEGLKPSRRMAGNVVRAGLIDGVLAADGLVVIYRAAAITHRQLGAAYDLVVHASGEATAKRVVIGKESTA